MSVSCKTSPAHAQDARPPNVYRKRRPEKTVAYQVVQRHLETWLAHHREADLEDDPIPAYVERDLRKFLECGILAHGFARARCDDCGHDVLVAFSCKGRGVCPSCNTRRMAETAAHLVDHVFPAVPVRQWVISFPKRLRYFLVRDTDLLNRVVRIALSEVERITRIGSAGASTEARTGGVAFLHRFGSALNVHIHLHICLIDGVIAQPSEGLKFHPTQLDDAAIQQARQAIRKRVLRLFKRRALLTSEVTEMMQTWGHGGGFSVHATVQIDANDSIGREQLFRYCTRPIFASERLAWEQHGERLRYRLTRPGPQGQTVLTLTPAEFLDRVAALILPPRKHRHRYVGVLAPNSPWRETVTARAGLPIETEAHAELLRPTTAPTESDQTRHPARYLWAVLLARIYETFTLTCTHCGGPMRIIACVTTADPINRILDHIGEPVTPPTPYPARAPPIEAAEINQYIPDAWLKAPPIPEFEFNQTVSW